MILTLQYSKSTVFYQKVGKLSFVVRIKRLVCFFLSSGSNRVPDVGRLWMRVEEGFSWGACDEVNDSEVMRVRK